jgi:hypothetical protein
MELDREIVKIKEKILNFEPTRVGELEIKPVWFDSYGAKSSSIFIKAPEVKLLIDPGCAGMQPGYPMPDSYKILFRNSALETIEHFSKEADTVVITHYHYDHHIKPGESAEIYRGKNLFVKNPNFWINDSQWRRAREFFKGIIKIFLNSDIEDFLSSPERVSFDDPVEVLRSSSLDFGEYTERRYELFEKGRKWLLKLFKKWSGSEWISEFQMGGKQVAFIDGKEFNFGDTKIVFSSPLFHGIEYDRIGWVISIVVKRGSKKVLYTSDLQGPQIEDYADWIIEENPDFLVVDGPPTYLFGYMMNRINLNRSIKNICRIMEGIKADTIIYDHHLLRDKRYRERVREVYDYAAICGKKLITAAEWIGLTPLIQILS